MDKQFPELQNKNRDSIIVFPVVVQERGTDTQDKEKDHLQINSQKFLSIFEACMTCSSAQQRHNMSKSTSLSNCRFPTK